MRARYWDYKILDKIRKVKDIKRHFIAIFALTRMHLGKIILIEEYTYVIIQISYGITI